MQARPGRMTGGAYVSEIQAVRKLSVLENEYRKSTIFLGVNELAATGDLAPGPRRRGRIGG